MEQDLLQPGRGRLDSDLGDLQPDLGRQFVRNAVDQHAPVGGDLDVQLGRDGWQVRREAVRFGLGGCATARLGTYRSLGAVAPCRVGASVCLLVPAPA